MAGVNITPPPLSNASMADLLCTIMLLCRSVHDDNRPYWAYLCIKPSMAKAFKEARESGSLKLEEFGTILEMGDGIDPPPDVRRRMETDYGVNHTFEDQLLDGLIPVE